MSSTSLDRFTCVALAGISGQEERSTVMAVLMTHTCAFPAHTIEMYGMIEMNGPAPACAVEVPVSVICLVLL